MKPTTILVYGLIVPLAFLSIATAFSGCIRTVFATQKAARAVTLAVAVPESRKCRIRTTNGRVNCIADDVSEIEVVAQIVARAATVEQAKSAAEQITVQQRDVEGVTEIIADVPPGINGGVSMTITLPHEMVLDIESSNGAVDVTGVAGDLHIETSNGSVRITDCAGKFVARSSNGSMKFHSDAMAGVVAKTSNGSVEIGGSLQPGEYRVTTSNGSVTVNSKGMPIIATASTSNGTIKANGEKVKKKETIRLGLSEAADESPSDVAQVTVSTSNGSVNISHSP